MRKYLAIVVYRAAIEGHLTGSLDFQVRYFEDSDPDRVRLLLESEKAVEYLNDQQETVRWEFCKLLAIEPYLPSENISGAELLGFITELNELQQLVEAK